MKMQDILRNIQRGIENQLRYGNFPKYFYCTPEIAQFICEMHEYTNCDGEKCYILGLQIVPNNHTTSYFVR